MSFPKERVKPHLYIYYRRANLIK